MGLMVLRRLAILGVCGAALAGCEGGTGSIGPDEFGLIPTLPLEQPKDYTYLPEPTKGGANRVDRTPKKDAVAALGGQPLRLDSTGILAGEQALLTTATRYGVDPDIRKELAAADAELLRTRGARILERVAGHSDTIRAYEPFVLDARAEAARLRALGIKTPTPRSEPPEEQP